MATFAELEIAIRRRDVDQYTVECRLSPPDSDADERFPTRDTAVATISPTELELLSNTPEQYGAALGAALFQNADIKAGFAKARAVAQTAGAALRVRLFVEPAASELHRVRWETLRDPAGDPVFTGERILVSRYLSSGEWRAVKLRPKSELRALIVIANPKELEESSPAGQALAPVDVQGELGRARAALKGTTLTELASGGSATVPRIMAELRKGIDIVYLVCHGSLRAGEPRLWLEGDNGEVKVESGATFAAQIRELAELPRLVVLASCQSAGAGSMSSFAPRLAEAGVPAVLAMQGNISMTTIEQFMPVFFEELHRDGQIDRATGVARGRVAGRSDCWMPVLFMRLRSGRIWYVPGFDGSKSEFDQWRPICDQLRTGECVPIVGPGLAEHVAGSVRSIALSLAEENSVPLSEQDRTDLSKVTQYIATKSSVQAARTQVRAAMLSRIRSHAPRLVPGSDGSGEPPALIGSIVSELSKREDDPLRIVASLDCKVIVTAAADPLLEMILTAAGKPAKVMATGWRDERENKAAEDLRRERERLGQGAEGLVEPSLAQPLLYYMFGKSQMEDTWVLTEDDIYDYLIQTTRYNLMPTIVRSRLSNGSLLFLGFTLEDWKFRVLLRMILSIPGSFGLNGYSHVGVQISPDETVVTDARRAREYLERYFQRPNPTDPFARNPKIDIFWGSSADFLRELKNQMAKQPAQAAAAAW